MFDIETEDYVDTFVSVAQCAKAMDITEDQVRRLIKLRVLRTRYAWGDVMVQPAVVAGWTA